MYSPYIGQVFMFGFDFAPKNYALCNGQLMAIAQNQALFSILGTVFGGNGMQTFGLPDLRGRTYMGQGAGPGLTAYVLGERVGAQAVTLQQPNLPTHNHLFNVSNGAATSGVPGTGVVLSQGPVVTNTVPVYSSAAASGTMNANELATAGGNQPLPVLQPYLTINFSVALYGLFPSRN